MKRSNKNRIFAFLLAFLMLASGMIVPVAAAEPSFRQTVKSDDKQISISDISEILDAISYAEYREKYKDVPKGDRTYTVAGTDYNTDPSLTTAKIQILSEYAGFKGDSLYVPETGTVSFTFNVETAGMYAVDLEYCQYPGKTNDIERIFYLNGSVPFSEARSTVLKKNYIYAYEGGDEDKYFAADLNGNDIRPEVCEDLKWTTVTLIDSNGYYTKPFQFYMDAGENTITFESSREAIVIGSVSIKPYQDELTFEEYVALHGDPETNRGEGIIKVEGEHPLCVTNATICPTYDRTSAITSPQSASVVRYNTVGGDKWTTVGEGVTYSVEVPVSGYYAIGVRYQQDINAGMYASRKVLIDGEVPYFEAYYCRFNYSSNWQHEYLHNGTSDLEFYLEAGTHEITLIATLGEMGEYIQQVDETLTNINKCYLEILKLTGPAPDKDRDYGFRRVMPGILQTMMLEAINLDKVIDYLTEQNGGKRSQSTSVLEQVSILLKKMAGDDDEVAANLANLKSYIGSLGTWIKDAKTQPLTIDYLTVQPITEKLPSARPNGFRNLIFQLGLFFSSFVTDYNSLGATIKISSENSIEVWVVTGRDEASIIRNLIDNTFTPQSNISVNLKLVSAGTLLPSVLAGAGPDVSLWEGDPISYAIRNALMPLNEFVEKDLENGEDVLARFPDAALTSLKLRNYLGVDESGNDYVEETLFGLPDKMTFSMMFYRKDILADLELEVPTTWEDLLKMIPVLQSKNMEIGIQNDLNTYMYQAGGTLYTDYGMRINFDSKTALTCFTKLCNMYTQYSLEYVYDFANRFRTGEMPIGIAAYTMCNQLSVFASELSGLWDFVRLPGTLRTDDLGNVYVDNSAPVTVTACIMLADTENPETAWEFMKWYTGSEYQVSYSNEIVALQGVAARPATATTEALQGLPWTTDEYMHISEQFEHLVGIENNPGNYILGRYYNFAFLAVYNDGEDPAESLYDYVSTINKEITRKRTEFEMITLAPGETLAQLKEEGKVPVLSAEEIEELLKNPSVVVYKNS